MTKRLVDNFQLSKLEGSYVVPTIFMSISNHVNWSFIIEQYITIKVFIFNLWGRWTHNHLQRNEPNLVKGQTKNRKKLESCFVLVIDLGMYYLNMAILDFFSHQNMQFWWFSSKNPLYPSHWIHFCHHSANFHPKIKHWLQY